MKTDELIESLASGLEPARPLATVQVRMSLWAGAALLSVGVGTAAFGVRSDLLHKISQPAYRYESASLLALFACSAWGAFRSSVPGLAERTGLHYAPLFAWPALVLARGLFSLHASLQPTAAGVVCVERMFVLGLAPTLGLWAMLRRAAPLDAGWTGQLALLASSSLAMLGTQAVCAKDAAAHVLLWHVVPVLCAAWIGLRIGRVVFLAKGATACSATFPSQPASMPAKSSSRARPRAP